MDARLDRRGITLTDVVVGLVLLLVIAGWCLGQVAALDDAARRAQCKANLRQIGLAMWRYADANRGAFPRTVYDMETADKPVWGTPYEGGAEAKDDADPFAKDDSPVAKY